jgi:hypothetical protein
MTPGSETGKRVAMDPPRAMPAITASSPERTALRQWRWM